MFNVIRVTININKSYVKIVICRGEIMKKKIIGMIITVLVLGMGASIVYKIIEKLTQMVPMIQ